MMQADERRLTYDHMMVDAGLATILAKLLLDAGHFLEKDHVAARACIDRASALLEGESGRQGAAGSSTTAAARNALAPWQVKRVSAYVDDHLGSTLRIYDLAVFTRLTVSYFSRAFKGSFGMPPHAYIVKRRMERAQELMLTTDESLCQIALACGLSDQAHLSRMFHREFGLPPAVWRRERRGCVARPRAGRA